MCRFVNLSPILGEIAVGVALGPRVLDMVPYSHTTEYEEDHHLDSPGVFVLAGQLGVTLMIMESGMHMHLEKLKAVGAKATVVAAIGTLLPVVAGVLTVYALGFDVWPNGVAAGVALAPTSVGIALKLLTEAKQMSSTYGQTIITAAFIDDVVSLILLVILLNLAGGSITVLSVSLPILSSVLFVAAGIFLGEKVFPKAMDWLLKKVKDNPLVAYQPRDEVHLFVLFAVLVVYGYIGSLIGSHLLGAFVAGISFTKVPRSMLVWKRQIKRIAAWLLRMFFASAVAFAIPVDTMLSFSAFWKGMVVGLLPCVATKLVSGVFVGVDRWVVGVAMVGRGEFAYLVAETSSTTELDGKTDTLMNDEVFSIVVWALLVSTVVAPIAFQKVLRHKLANTKIRRSSSIGERSEVNRGAFKIRLEGRHHTGLLHEVCDVLHSLSLDVLEALVESDGDVDVDVFTVCLRNGADLDDQKIAEIRHEVLEAVDDPEAQVVFMPLDKHANKVLKLQVMASHHRELLHEICDFLSDVNLDVTKAVVQEMGNVDVDLFYARHVNRDLPINRGVITKVKKKVGELFQKHKVHGEAMVKTISAEPNHLDAPSLPLLYGEAAKGAERMIKVVIQGVHEPHVLHELTDMLAADKLDVIHAVIDQPGVADKPDNAMFICKAPSATDLSTEYRAAVREKLLECFRHHDCVGSAGVTLLACNKDGDVKTLKSSPAAGLRPFASPSAMLRSCRRTPQSGADDASDRSPSPFSLSGLPLSDMKHTPTTSSPLARFGPRSPGSTPPLNWSGSGGGGGGGGGSIGASKSPPSTPPSAPVAPVPSGSVGGSGGIGSPGGSGGIGSPGSAGGDAMFPERTTSSDVIMPQTSLSGVSETEINISVHETSSTAVIKATKTRTKKKAQPRQIHALAAALRAADSSPGRPGPKAFPGGPPPAGRRAFRGPPVTIGTPRSDSEAIRMAHDMPQSTQAVRGNPLLLSSATATESTATDEKEEGEGDDGSVISHDGSPVVLEMGTPVLAVGSGATAPAAVGGGGDDVSAAAAGSEETV